MYWECPDVARFWMQISLFEWHAWCYSLTFSHFAFASWWPFFDLSLPQRRVRWAGPTAAENMLAMRWQHRDGVVRGLNASGGDTGDFTERKSCSMRSIWPRYRSVPVLVSDAPRPPLRSSLMGRQHQDSEARWVQCRDRSRWPRAPRGIFIFDRFSFLCLSWSTWDYW